MNIDRIWAAESGLWAAWDVPWILPSYRYGAQGPLTTAGRHLYTRAGEIQRSAIKQFLHSVFRNHLVISNAPFRGCRHDPTYAHHVC